VRTLPRTILKCSTTNDGVARTVSRPGANATTTTPERRHLRRRWNWERWETTALKMTGGAMDSVGGVDDGSAGGGGVCSAVPFAASTNTATWRPTAAFERDR